jgi:subtilase family serine protease
MLTPGNYGALMDNGTLELSPGSYSFSSVTLSNAAQVWVPQGGVHISVAGALTTGSRVTISPGFLSKADQLTISVAGSDSSTGSPAVFIGQFSLVHALLAAPNGTLIFDEGVQASGAFAAFDIKAEPGVAVQFDAGFSASTAGQHGSQQLSGYVPADPSVTPLVGPVPADTPVHLAVGLPARNAGNLPTLAAQVSDPTSPMYRQYLTVDQFVQMFGAAPTDYQALTGWAQSAGLTIDNTHRNNLLLSVGGTAVQVEQALYTNLVYRLRSDGSNFITVDREPSLDLSVPILRISGLNDVIAPEPMIRFTGLIQSNQGSAGPDAGSGPGGLFAGPDFRAAYAPGVSQTGAGQTVALLEWDGFYTNDIASYQRAFSLNVPVNRHLLNNFDGKPCSGSGKPCRREAEAALDIEMAMSMAPGLASVEVYEGTQVNSMLAEIAAPPPGVPLSNQVSSSLIYGIDDNTRSALYELAIQGQSFFLASGDLGAYTSDPGNNYQDQPWTTLVGGTVLSMNGSGASWKSETTWPGSGGGILTNLSIPDYQKNLNFSQNTQLSMTNRNAPDVSLVASGVLSYSGNGSQGNTGGTSVAAPLWAGYMALVNQLGQANAKGTVGFANYLLYQIGLSANYSKDFHDINDGSTNPSSDGTKSYTAVNGFDLTTGWGTPTAALINDLSGVPAAPPVVTISYHQVGACNGFPTPFGESNLGPNAAYVIFGIEEINNSQNTAAFAFDPTKLYVQQAIQEFFDPRLQIYRYILGPFAATATTVNADIRFAVNAFGATVVATTNSNGAVEANQTPYFLKYNASPSDPNVNLVKTDAARTSWPQTLECTTIKLQ